MKLTIITGPMYSSKSTALVAALRRAQIAGFKVVPIKHAFDVRYSKDEIVTHDDIRHKTATGNSLELFTSLITPSCVVGVDEVQFFDPRETLDFVLECERKKVHSLFLAGLNLDFLGRPFPSIQAILPYADTILLTKAVCTFSPYCYGVCGEEASLTQQVLNGNAVTESSDVVQVGGLELYAPRCKKHFYKFSNSDLVKATVPDTFDPED